MIEDGIDRMKTAAGDVPVVVVGGGGFLIHDRPRGASALLRPQHAPVANAIGAAIGQVSGELDRVVSYAGGRRDELLAEIRRQAAESAVAAGAAPATVEVIEVEEVALNYLPGQSVRVRARAVGDLEFA